MRIRFAAGLVVALCLAGCRQSADPSAPAGDEAPSLTRDAIDGLTGKTAVEAGKRAEKRIQGIAEQRNSDLEEVLDE